MLMLKKRNNTLAVFAVLALFGGYFAATTWAGYAQYGDGMQTVLAGSGIANGALYLDANTTWINSLDISYPPAPGNGVTKPYTLDTSFTMPGCDNIVEARLLMTVWGATADHTCGLSASVNGNSAVSSMTMGSTSDANPTFDGTKTCVYGGGYGVWLVSVPVSDAMLKTDGSGNAVSVTVTDATQNFDGRIQQVSLLAVYQDSTLNNTFDYVVAEGSGDIYRDEDLTQSPPKVESRTIGLGNADTSGVTGAKLHALYTYGTDEQNDRLYFNGVQFGGDDVADFDADTSPCDYGPDLVSFDVTAALAAANDVKFTVSDADGVPDTLEFSLRPNLAVLEVTHVPEPASLAVLALGSLAFLRRRRS
jgi:hypothetical protein